MVKPTILATTLAQVDLAQAAECRSGLSPGAVVDALALSELRWCEPAP